MGADDDVGVQRQRLLALVAALAVKRTEQRDAILPELAAALLYGMLDLEGVEGCARVETHELFGIVRRGIRRGAPLPQHGADAQLTERRHLFGAKIVPGNGKHHLAAAKGAGGNEADNSLTRGGGLSQPHVNRKPQQRWGHLHVVEI